MVRNASRALKIGVHLRFGPKFDVANRTFYPEKFRLAYCTGYILRLQQDDPQLLVDLPQGGDLFLLKMLRAGESIKKHKLNRLCINLSFSRWLHCGRRGPAFTKLRQNDQ